MIFFKKQIKTNDIAELEARIVELSEKAKNFNNTDRVRYIQVEFKNEGNPQFNYTGGDLSYQEWVASLLSDSRFQWLIYKRQMQMIDIMNALPTGDPQSAEMRQRAAYRMDGIQMLIDDMCAMKKAHEDATRSVKEEGLS